MIFHHMPDLDDQFGCLFFALIPLGPHFFTGIRFLCFLHIFFSVLPATFYFIIDDEVSFFRRSLSGDTKVGLSLLSTDVFRLKVRPRFGS